MPLKREILFVDDEPKVLDAHRRSFWQYRDVWSTRYATSGEEALRLLEETPADVVVSDLSMPGMKGLELVATVRGDYPETQCIILTGTADLQSAVDAINRVDVFRFYMKPCASAELTQGIQDALDASAAARGASAPDDDFDIGKAALDRLPFGVFVVDPDGRALFVNAVAAELVAANDGIGLSKERNLRAARPADTEAMLLAVGNAAVAGGGDEHALFVERPSGQRPLIVLVQPFHDGAAAASGDGRVAVFVTDPDRALSVSPAVLSGLFGLTRSEGKLLAALVTSGKLEEAAEENGLTLSTARTYLKQIYSKTSTGRQGELIQMVLLSPAVIKPTA